MEAGGSSSSAVVPSPSLEFRLLGPLEVRRGSDQVPLGGGRPRALLALLLVHRGEAVSTDRIVDELWGESPPPSARHMVEVYVSGLRRELGKSRILREPPGYRVRLEPEELDVDPLRAPDAPRGARRSPPARPSMRRPASARRSSSGEAPRWPTSPTSRSPRSRRAGSRSSSSMPRRSGSTRSSRSATRPGSSRGWRSTSRGRPCGSAATGSSCSRSPRPAARPTPSPPTSRRGGGS